VDPIHPIVPGPPAIQPGLPPVQRLERISRERDRPSKDRQRQHQQPPAAPEPERGEDDGEHRHIDVRV
jgi:hypothetical protein